MQVKSGTRIRSAVCATEVMVIQAPDADADIRCGGAGMLPLGEESAADAAIDPAAKGGTQIGKRYVDEEGSLELLCTKPGEGSLALGEQLLSLKEAKPLPSSD